MDSLLRRGEALEASAAAERVEYLHGLGVLEGPILDVGCGNGCSVRELRGRGFLAVGVDCSLYRLSRWVEEGRDGRHLVVADAARLPFLTGSFATVVSSGMLEHIGVAERAGPYRVAALPEKHLLRARAVTELGRVSCGTLVLDFPNGWFPVDFWHGDAVGAFRLHAVPDDLNPSVSEVRAYLPGGRVTLLPLRGRLRFRQVSERRWGRLLSPLARLFVRALDRLPRASSLRCVLSPYLVVLADRHPAPARSGLTRPGPRADAGSALA